MTVGADARPALWVLNLDADYELADPQGYTPSRAIEQRTQAFAQRLTGLLEPSDRVLDAPLAGAPSEPKLGRPSPSVPLPPPSAAHPRASVAGSSFIGRAWCPTPRALARLVAAGATPVPSPSLAVLQRVNDRRFAIELDPGPLQARYLTELDRTLAALGQRSPSGRWLLKRAFGLAGRGHRRLDGAVTEADVGWLRNSFKSGHGVALEPFVTRIVDVALHGWVAPDGAVALGRALLSHCDARGTWQETRALPDGMLLDAEHALLHAAARRAGHALHAAGYFGPYGIDAFAFRSADGGREFQPLLEINARYSMGWPLSGLRRGSLGASASAP